MLIEALEGASPWRRELASDHWLLVAGLHPAPNLKAVASGQQNSELQTRLAGRLTLLPAGRTVNGEQRTANRERRTVNREP